MAKSLGITATKSIETGDIIRLHPSALPAGLSQGEGEHIYGYVTKVRNKTYAPLRRTHHRFEDDDIVGFEVCPVITAEDADNNLRIIALPHQAYEGLPSRDYAVLVFPFDVPADTSLFGTPSAYTVFRAGSHAKDPINAIIERAASSMLPDVSEFPIKTQRLDLITMPVAGRVKDLAYRKERPENTQAPRLKTAGTSTSRRFGTQGADEGMIYDIKLADAPAQHLGLDEGLIRALTEPADDDLPPVETLRQLHTMAQENPALLCQYIHGMALEMPLARAPFENKMTAWSFHHPVSGKPADKVRTLRAAFDMVSKAPENLSKFEGVMTAWITEDVEKAVTQVLERGLNKKTVDRTIKSLKSVWDRFGHDNMQNRYADPSGPYKPGTIIRMAKKDFKPIG